MKQLHLLKTFGFLLFLTGQIQAQFSTSGTNTTTTNNVGIGTTNPQQKLDVRGNALIGGGDLILGKYDGREQGNNTQNRAMVHGFSDDLIINYDADFEGGVKIKGNVTTSANIATGGNIAVGGADLVLGTNDAREQGDNTQNRALVHGFNDDLIINFNGDFEGGTIIKGNLGIGTDNPSEKLEVGGNINASGSILSNDLAIDNGATNLRLYRDNDVGDWSLLRSDKGNGIGIIGQPDRVAIAVSRTTSKVGIGTTNPQNELSVNGTVWAKVVKVRLTDAADWVFDGNYKLRPLAEVKSFIAKNKHLPEIPSAEEFRANDLDVSKMTNKLLQKIEELTLYTIQQEEKLKEMEQLKARLSKLEALLK